MNNLLLYKNNVYCIHCYALCFQEAYCRYELSVSFKNINSLAFSLSMMFFFVLQ